MKYALIAILFGMMGMCTSNTDSTPVTNTPPTTEVSTDSLPSVDLVEMDNVESTVTQ
jgi:hypothetical protein